MIIQEYLSSKKQQTIPSKVQMKWYPWNDWNKTLKYQKYFQINSFNLNFRNVSGMTSSLWRNYTHFDGFEFIEAVTLPFSSRFIPSIEPFFVNKLTSYPPIVRKLFFLFAEFSLRTRNRLLREFKLLLSFMSDNDDFEEVPRTRPVSSRSQIPRNMSMNSLAKYLANTAEIEGLRSALKSGRNNYSKNS